MRSIMVLLLIFALSPLLLGLDCNSIGSNGTIYQNILLSDDLESAGDCLSIEANNVTLDCGGRLLTGGGTGTGIQILGRQGVTVKNCRVTGFGYGIRSSYSSILSLEGNEASGNNIGIYLLSSSGAFVSDNKADNNSNGMYLYDVFESEISGNRARWNGGHGLELRSSASDKVLRNDFSGNRFGLGIYSSSSIEATGNSLVGCYQGYKEEQTRGIASSGNSLDIISGSSWGFIVKKMRDAVAVVLILVVLGAVVYFYGIGRRNAKAQ